MCLRVGHMMGMELVEFLLATNGRGVLSMVITCVGRTMGKELLCSRRLLLGEGPSREDLDVLLQMRSL